jgi:hypothetical protein
VRDLDALDAYWQVFPAVRAALFKGADRPGYSQLNVAAADIKTAIFAHAEFVAFNRSTTTLYEKWKKANAPRLKGIAVGDKPKVLIEALSEDLLDTFRAARLLDAYDVYQHLLDYWAETMQDDVCILLQDGWKAVQSGGQNRGKLSEAEIKTLVVDDKWLSALGAAVQSELDRVSQALAGRIRQLAERYAAPLPQLADKFAGSTVGPRSRTWARVPCVKRCARWRRDCMTRTWVAGC